MDIMKTLILIGLFVCFGLPIIILGMGFLLTVIVFFIDKLQKLTKGGN